MSEFRGNAAVVFRAHARDACEELRLVLEAAEIDARVIPASGEWLLVVAAGKAAEALREIEAYGRENVLRFRPSSPEASLPVLAGGIPGAMAYAAVLLLVAAAATRFAYGADWMAAGRMLAGAVRQGEWWRVLTSLTLHVGPVHLAANLAFGAVLGYFAAQALGGGVAWLGILLAGGVGNALNAMVRDPRHSAVGASTAVFATLGILVAHAIRHRRSSHGGPLRRWSPLVAGVLLLAYTGTGGERTDVLAHVTGFLAGLVAGAAGSRIPVEVLEKRSVQTTAACSALLLLALGWLLALSSTG